jgi:hypothetical protein
VTFLVVRAQNNGGDYAGSFRVHGYQPVAQPITARQFDNPNNLTFEWVHDVEPFPVAAFRHVLSFDQVWLRNYRTQHKGFKISNDDYDAFYVYLEHLNAYIQTTETAWFQPCSVSIINDL